MTTFEQQQQAASNSAILALNNMGVSLLERHCYEQAADTFKDAVALVRAAMRQTSPITNAPSQHQQQSALHQARQRLARPQPASRQQDVQVLSSTAASTPKQQQQHCSSLVVIVALRIVEDGSSSTRSDNFVSAILLQNLGLSYYCLSKALSVTPRRSRDPRKTSPSYASGALRLFRISHSLLAKELASQSSVALLQLSALVLHTLIAALYESHLFAEARSFCSVHRDLQISMANLFLLEDQGAAAAA